MSIYFVQFLQSFLFLMVFAALFLKDLSLESLFKTTIIGFVFAYFAFYISAHYLGLAKLNLVQNLLLVILMLSLVFLIFFKNIFFIKEAFLLILAFIYSGKYLYISKDFPILGSAYLDNTAIASAFFILLAVFIIYLVLIFLKSIFSTQSKQLYVFLALLVIMGLSDALAKLGLYCMREGLIDPSELLLSFVAKGIYYSHFYSYVILAIVFILALNSLRFIPKQLKKRGYMDITSRINIGKKTRIKQYFLAAVLAFIIGFGVGLYYDLVASKGLSIGTPVVVEPNKDGNFVFDIKILRDNKLHRFAYVEDDGRISRFFLLNKREDKDSPVAVFDACKICGDMGYVKKGHELICVSCNVRIFLPSVGKEGGCNPITMKYKVENDKLIISLKQIKEGLGFFRNKMEKEVTDIISGKKLINLKAPFEYEYEGRTYFFENEANYKSFKTNPSKYIGAKNVL